MTKLNALLFFLVSVTTNAQLDQLFCLAPNCGNECRAFNGNGTAFTPDLLLVDSNITCREYVDTTTSFDEFTSRCVATIGESEATLSTAKILLYLNDEDCRAAESVLADLRDIGCCSGSSAVPDDTPTDAPIPDTIAPATPPPSKAPVVAPTNPVPTTAAPATQNPTSSATQNLEAIRPSSVVLLAGVLALMVAV
jgi:hypothetical protein